MKRYFASTALASACIVAVAGGAKAQSQETPRPVAPAAPSVATVAPAVPTRGQDSGPSAAVSPSGDQATTVQEVIVTAQKRSEDLSKVPISITSVSATALKDTGAKNLRELQSVVPGIYFPSPGSYGGAPISIRGTSGTAAFLQDDPVAVYVDGVYQSSNQFSVADLADLQSVDVVRGPQGTLQGRNATAGAILIRTADPSKDFSGFARASVADPQEYRLEGVVSGPISETLGFRLALDRFDERGWGKNLFNGDHVGGEESLNARGVLLWRPNERARVRLALNYADLTNNLAVARFAQTTINPPPGQEVTVPTPNIPLSQAAQNRFLDDKDFNLNTKAISKYQSPSLALEASYDLGPVSVVSITGASSFLNPGANDSDSLPTTDRGGYNHGKYTGHSVSEELRVQSNGKQRFQWILGGYASATHSILQFDIFNLFYSVPRNQDASFHAIQNNPTYAGFADGSFAITDKLSLSGGVRYTYENKDFNSLYLNTNLGTGAPVLGPIFFKAPTKEFYDTSYRGKLTYQFDPDIFAYVSYSKGFKSGGFNAFGVGAQPGYSPERLYSFEVGAKAYLLNRRAYVAGSVYDNEYDNLQVTSGVPTGGVVITNAAKAKINGFELEGEVKPVTNLSLTANLSYVDATYDSFPLAPNVLGAFVNASGNRLTNSPEWQYFLMASYTHRLTADWDAQAQLSYRWRDTVYFTPTDQNLTNFRGEPDGELGARINFHNDPLNLTVSVYGTNLNDERVVAGEGITFSYPQAFFNKPRSVGVQIEKRF